MRLGCPGRRWRRGALAAIGLTLCLAAGLALLDRLFPPDLSRLRDLSREVQDRDGERLRGYLSADGYRRMAVTPAEVDPGYLRMLLAYEDKRFRNHAGVDPLALLRATGQALMAGRIVSGASTLTMQTARLLQPRPRGIATKLREMLRALQLEWHYDKTEILSMYLTLAPFGGNLEGVAAAAWRYFGRPPRNLTAEEAALLVALPQSPSRLRPDRRPAAARAARDKVLRRVAAGGLLSTEALAAAIAEPVLPPQNPLPPAAPHLADRLVAAVPTETILRSTIDGTLQRRWEIRARNWAQDLGPHVSVAILAVANADRRVLAYIGSANFADAARAGQVDVVRALRSPGSTLKPAIYGLAFEQGRAHPATLVDDVPTQFGNYAPANFMQQHHGRVTLSTALRRSLNVPAVALLERLGPVAVVERLRRAGLTFSFGRPDVTPGLAFALGGVGTTLEDLVRLYAALADDGRARPLDFGVGTPPRLADATPLFGAAARWYIGAILRGARPPGSLLPDRHRRLSRPLAFKTGTSYGFRDAWAIGYDRDYTVGVWVGRPDGTPSPGRYGANTAAPLLFRLYDDLQPSGRGWPAKPPRALPLAVKLPPGLRRLGEDFARATIAAAGPAPRILFPPDDTTLGLADRQDNVTLEADGGRRPLTWIVNGRPLPTRRQRRRAVWQPDGIGFHDIVLVDALGRRATARIRLVAP